MIQNVEDFMFFTIDLSKYYNHIIYKNQTVENDINLNKKTIYGLPHFNNILIVDKKRETVRAFNIDFYCACGKSIFDNVMCDGQVIEIERKEIKVIAFLGFCEMGTVCDEVRLHTDNNVISIPLVMKTFHSDNFKGIDDGEKNTDCKLAFYLNGDDKQKHGVFFWQVVLPRNYDINAIELPVNCAMHLFSITLI